MACIYFSLFTSVDEAVWQIGTIPLFRALFDNYDEVQKWLISKFSGIGHKVGPRLRESRLLVTSGHGVEFTQPRVHLLADPCT